MNGAERQSRFAQEVERVVNYFRDEYRLTYADAAGVLFIMATELSNECIDKMRQEQSEDEEVDDPE